MATTYELYKDSELLVLMLTQADDLEESLAAAEAEEEGKGVMLRALVTGMKNDAAAFRAGTGSGSGSGTGSEQTEDEQEDADSDTDTDWQLQGAQTQLPDKDRDAYFVYTGSEDEQTEQDDTQADSADWQVDTAIDDFQDDGEFEEGESETQQATSEAQQATSASDGEQAQPGPSQSNLLRDEDGNVLHGTYRFMAMMDGYLQLKNGDAHVAWIPDAWNLRQGAQGWIVLDVGVADDPRLDPPPPERKVVDPQVIQTQNVGILNAMFVDGASSSQRSARVLADRVVMILKNVHDQSGDDRLDPGYGAGTIQFVRNRMSPNEIIITDEGGLDVDLVKRQLQDLFDRDRLKYPYRDKSRIRIHD